MSRGTRSDESEDEQRSKPEKQHSNAKAIAEWGCCLGDGCAGCFFWLALAAGGAWWIGRTFRPGQRSPQPRALLRSTAR